MPTSRFSRRAPFFAVLGACVFLCGCTTPTPPAPVHVAVGATKIPPTPKPRVMGYLQNNPSNEWLKDQLQKYRALRGSNIEVEWTSKNTMALRGTVVSERQKRSALRIARRVSRQRMGNTPLSDELVVVKPTPRS